MRSLLQQRLILVAAGKPEDDRRFSVAPGAAELHLPAAFTLAGEGGDHLPKVFRPQFRKPVRFMYPPPSLSATRGARPGASPSTERPDGN